MLGDLWTSFTLYRLNFSQCLGRASQMICALLELQECIFFLCAHNDCINGVSLHEVRGFKVVTREGDFTHQVADVVSRSSFCMCFTIQMSYLDTDQIWLGNKRWFVSVYSVWNKKSLQKKTGSFLRSTTSDDSCCWLAPLCFFAFIAFATRGQHTDFEIITSEDTQVLLWDFSTLPLFSHFLFNS